MLCMFLVQQKTHASSAELSKTKSSLNDLATGRKVLPELLESEFLFSDITQIDIEPMRFDVNLLNLKASENRLGRLDFNESEFYGQDIDGWMESTLIEPPRYVLCKNPNCFTVMPFDGKNVLICSKCGETQLAASAEPTMADDLDEDGIPDYIEKKYAFLDYRYKYDAYDDQDGDGFTNGEEFAAGTDMTNPKEVPMLGYMVRVIGQPFNQRLPFVLNRIRKVNNSEYKTDWRVIFDKNPETKIGEQLKNFPGYYLLDIIESDMSVVVQTPKGEKIVMKKGKPATENALSVKLRLMRSRFGMPIVDETMVKNTVASSNPAEISMAINKAKAEAIFMSQDFTQIVREGDIFELVADTSGLSKHERSGNIYENNGISAIIVDKPVTKIAETYRLVGIENKKNKSGQPQIKVYIERITQNGNDTIRRIEVRAFDHMGDVSKQNRYSEMSGNRNRSSD